jgi:hypothetical protein
MTPSTGLPHATAAVGRIFGSMDEEGGRLVVDRGAATEPISEEEFRAWAREQRVFISSVMEELSEERRAVADHIEDLGFEPVLFERFGGREDDAQAA